MESEFDKRVKELQGIRKASRKRDEDSLTVKKLWAPSIFLPRKDSFLLGKYNFTPVDIIAFPKVIPPMLCASFYNPNSDVVVVETFRKIPNGEISRMLEKAEQSAKTNLMLLKDTSGFDANILRARIGSLEGSKEYLLGGGAFWEFETKIFTRIAEADVRNDIEFRAYLDNTQRIKDILQGGGFTVRKRFMNMKKYINYLAPIAYKEADFTRSNEFQPFTTEAIRNLFPIVVGSNFGSEGDVYGRDIVTGLPVVIDRFQQDSYHMAVLGQTGSGKSFFVKMSMLRYMLRDNQAKIFILDPLGEYVKLAVKLGGTIIDMSENVINPLDLMTTASTAYPKGDVRDKVNRVLTLFGIYFSGLNDQQLSIISKALTKLYERDSDVIFTNLIAEVKSRPNYENDVNAQLLTESLNIFVDGSLKNLNRKTNVNLSGSLIVFDLSKSMDEKMRQFFMFFITDFLYGQVSKDFDRKLVFIDEARYFMMYREMASFINNFVVHARHFNCGVTLITQNISDFYTEEGGDFSISVLNNAYSVAIFYNKDIPDKFVKAHRLTDNEVEFIRTETGIQPRIGGGKVSQCLLIQKDKRFRLVVEGLPLESELITTNPEELKARSEGEIR